MPAPESDFTEIDEKIQEIINKLPPLERNDVINWINELLESNYSRWEHTVCETAEKVVSNARKSSEYNNVLVHIDWIKKLQQALAAKRKNETP